MLFPNRVLSSDFFNSYEQKINRLKLFECAIISISGNAFSSIAFQQLETLELIDLPLTDLSKNALAGLNSLKTLTMQKLNLHQLTSEHLYHCKSLQRLNFLRNKESILDISELTGTIRSPLIYITFNHNNLPDTITYQTFNGARLVTEIDLENNRIVTIAPNAFLKTVKTLKVLNLAYNRLKRLPDEFFRFFHLKSTHFLLHSNPWECDCELEALRFYLAKRIINIVESPSAKITCKNAKYHDQEISSIPALCNISGEAIQSAAVNCSNEDRLIEQNFLFQRKPQEFRIKRSVYDELVLVFNEFQSEDIFIGFDDSDMETTQCFMNDEYAYTGNHNVEIKLNMEPNKLHRLCLMKEDSTFASEKECLLFYMNDDWDREKYHKMIILLIMTNFISMLCGIGIWFTVGKFFPNVNGKRKPVAGQLNILSNCRNCKYVKHDF